MKAPVWWFERARASRLTIGLVAIVGFLAPSVASAWGIGPALGVASAASASYYAAWWLTDVVRRARSRA